MDFYFTFGTGHIGYPGYVKITAPDAGKARDTMVKYYGEKWSMQHSRLNDVHELDRNMQDTLVWPE